MNNIRLAQPLLIRLARLEDVDALHAACFPDEGYDCVEDYLRWCLESPERPARLVALLDDYLVAHVELTPRQNAMWAEVSHLVMAKPFLQPQLEQRVVAGAARFAQRWGCSHIRLQLPVQAQQQIKKYESWGFDVHGFPLGGYCWLTLPVTRYPLPYPNLFQPPVPLPMQQEVVSAGYR